VVAVARGYQHVRLKQQPPQQRPCPIKHVGVQAMMVVAAVLASAAVEVAVVALDTGLAALRQDVALLQVCLRQ